MTKFIEVKDGCSVKKNNIESVEKITIDGQQDNGSRVTLKGGAVFESTFPYTVLLQLLETDIEEIQQDRYDPLKKYETFLAS